MSEDKNKLIYCFRKNTNEQVRISVAFYKGHDCFDIRTYFKDERGKFKPAKQGIMMKISLFPQFLEGIENLKKHLLEENKNKDCVLVN